jgi:hypothetical protein
MIVVSFGVACVRITPRSAVEAPSIPGLEAAVKPGTLALFGDIHGTAEIPAFVGDMASSLARQQRVHVGLELPVAETLSLQAFLSSGDDQALRQSAMWTRAYQDGRTSEAVLALLRRLRDARKSGLSIEVFFFADQDRLGIDRRDEAMAENIALERSRAPSDIYLVEVGNLHAKTSVGAPWDPSKRWMGFYLAAREHRVLTFDVRAPPGNAWICSSAKEESCGVIKVGTYGQLDTSVGAKRAVILRQGTLDGYDGTFMVERLTASRPAFAN